MSIAVADPAGSTASRHFGVRFTGPLALGSMLNPVNSTMISTALVPIGRDLHVGSAATGWLVASLYLTSAVAQPVMGSLADRFGARRVYLLALVLVAAAGLIGNLAPSFAALIGVRVLLGVGTSGAYPSAMRLFRLEADRAGLPPPRRAMGMLSLAAISTGAVGPLLGGVLTGAFGWHAIFTVNLPLALLGIVLVLLWIPPDPPAAASAAGDRIDVAGIALFTALLTCLMLFLMRLAPHPQWWLLVPSSGLGVVFVLHSRRRRAPFIDVRLLAANLPLSLTYLRMGVISVIPYAILYGIGQWLESAAHVGASTAGLVMLPLSLVAAAASLLGARSRSIRLPFILAGATSLLGSICLLLVDHRTSPLLIAAVLMTFGAPQGLGSTATQAAVYLQAPADQMGSAAGLQRTAAYIGAILASSLLALFYGRMPTDGGLHGLSIAIGGLSALLLVGTLLDRTLPRASR